MMLIIILYNDNNNCTNRFSINEICDKMVYYELIDIFLHDSEVYMIVHQGLFVML